MKRTALIAAALVLASTGTQAADPDAAIKYRQNLMKVVGGSVTAIGAALKGEAGQASDLAALTQILASVTDPKITGPAFNVNTAGQGSVKHTSKDNIWTDWDKFAGIAVKLNENAKAAAAKGADVTFADMKPVFAQCKACHDDFREK